jgi:hypothetical protein
MVPNLPYFMVQFDHKGENGYGHVIEGVGGGTGAGEEDGPDEGEKGEQFPRYDFYFNLAYPHRLTRPPFTDILQPKSSEMFWSWSPGNGDDRKRLISGKTRKGQISFESSTINTTGPV